MHSFMKEGISGTSGGDLTGMLIVDGPEGIPGGRSRLCALELHERK